LLYGTAAPEALVERALELDYRALALTDRDNLYLAIRFYQTARAEGLTPLLGCVLSCGQLEVLLLPVDRRGYSHMCKLITQRHLEPGFDLAAVFAASEPEPLASGLHVIVESSGLAATLLAAGVPAARGAGGPFADGAVTGRPPWHGPWHAPKAADRTGASLNGAGPSARSGGLWMSVRGLPRERPGLAERVAAAHRLGVPLVATGDCAMLKPSDHEAHRAAVTAAAGELLERMPPSAFCAREAWLASAAEWERRVRAVCAGAGVPAAADEALANNRALAGRCRLELELGTPIFPRAPLPPGESGPGYLLRLCEAGVRRRYGRHCRASLARLRQELAMIARMGFTDYFLLVAEIVEFARARGIPTVGRGSGASSIVAYCLGITNVDPLRYGLTFERFLNPARRDCPDLDIDLCWRRRDEVIAHVYETYGADRVAMISTHATLGARSAFRETAKALGISNARVNALASRIPRDLEKPYLQRLASVPEARGVEWSEPPLAQALELAERLDGAPRHLSIHSGGIVIGDRPLTHYVPLERAAKQIVVTQFEMRAIEAIGLVKMDLLGNRALSTIGECLELVRRRTDSVSAVRGGGSGRAAALDLERVADGDPATAARIAAGDTLNCFQLESPAMRHLLCMLDARSLDDTIAAVALVRPGPAESGMKEAFCRRRRGLETPSFLHPRLQPVLGPTHGVMLYEEDVMRVTAALTGLSLAEGDDLRRAIGAARSEDEFRSLERGFVAHAARAGITEEVAGAVWRELTRFAAYAFCKAHAAGYGTLGYHSAYLKTHFPAEYAVAILNHHAGMYATWVHVEDLRRHGVEFRPPCVQRSKWDSALELDGDSNGAARGTRPAAVRVGLGRVFGLAHGAGERIVADRAAHPFRSLADFVDRVRPALPELESLILAGALDWAARSRPSLLLEARAGGKAWAAARGRAREPQLAAPGGGTIAAEPAAPVPVPELPEFSLAARIRGESRATGLWFSGHPLEVLVPAAARRGTSPAASLPGLAGRRAVVVGLPCAYRRVETKGGGLMLFLTVADTSGLAECVLFPEAYRKSAGAVRAEVVRVEGRVDETLGAITLVADRVSGISAGG
jgi:DNA-directed DNA polymerase III PolC